MATEFLYFGGKAIGLEALPGGGFALSTQQAGGSGLSVADTTSAVGAGIDQSVDIDALLALLGTTTAMISEQSIRGDLAKILNELVNIKAIVHAPIVCPP